MTVNLGISQLSGRTFGKMQVMTNVQGAYNLLAAVHELERDYGEIVTFNEGDRPRPMQIQLRGEYIAYLNGGPWAPLAAFCTWGPPPQFTSTHDEINYGNAADLGGPGGAVISERARNLLDGNHSDGVLGRKYGIYNTGRYFVVEERWHFNVYPERAQVLAPAPTTSTEKPGTKPAPEEARDMKVMKAASYWFAMIGARLWKIGDLRVAGRKIPGSQVRDLLRRVEASTAANPAEFNDLEFEIIRAATKRFK